MGIMVYSLLWVMQGLYHQRYPLVLQGFTMKPRELEHGFRMITARIPYILYLKGTRIMMFQLSGLYFRALGLYG